MSELGDHHYVPQFHLNRWADDAGKIIQWGRVLPSRKLIRKKVTSAQTAYKPGLYALSATETAKRQLIETEIFGRIDHSGSLIMDKLITRQPLNPEERAKWAFYINALVVRAAHLVEKMRSEMARRIEEEFSKNIDEYNAVKGSSPEETLYEWGLRNAPHSIANSALNVLVNMIRNEDALSRIMKLHWIVRNIPYHSNKFVLSDNPVHRETALYGSQACWVVPLSPTHIFVAAANQAIINKILSFSNRDIAKEVNIRSLGNSERFAYGDANRLFIERHFLIEE